MDQYSSADMPKRKRADVIAGTVTQQQPIWDRCISTAAIPECTNDGSCCNNSDNGTTSLQDQFPELPKRDTHVRQSTNPYAPSKLPIDYAAIVKRNVIQPPKPTMPAYANLSSKDSLLQTPKQAPIDAPLCQEAAFDNVSPPLQSPTTLCPQEHAHESTTMTNGSQEDSAAEQRSNDARSAEQQQSKLNPMPNYADIVKRSPKYADMAKRKACSPPEYAPSKKVMKQDNSLTVRAGKTQEPGTNDAAIVPLESQLLQDQAPKTDITAPQSLPSNISKSPEPLGCHNDLAPSDDTKPPNITPYAEIVRRNTSKNHPSTCGDTTGGGTKRGAPFKPKLVASLDRLEQLLMRPARIPWVETGDPLMELYQKERKLANDYGYKMNEYFKLSQKHYHARDWVNAKLYSNEGHRFRERMHKLHTQASRRIFEQRNQQDALFIDLHGMHVDEAQANIDQWFHELQDHRGIVYIVTGTGHHSRSGNRKESKLRPAVHTYLCNMYRCEETSVLGDDKGGVFAVYLCPHRFNPAIPHCVYCKFRPTK
ncbi:hypothetical protein BJV82DRAFT_240833 [Fennellomyces sp. T-0311]|nr:hypothetical protein BJV82DRAFT_240833 [Fennellomyces sp. T-0311]